jgi:hypothetical protein
MCEKYKTLYQEEAEKLSQNIAISSSMNQSINNFLVIQTFITSICFYLSKYYLRHINFQDNLYIGIFVLWGLSCLFNIIILCCLIWQLFSITYALPIFKDSYSKKLIHFLDKNGRIDDIYKDWFEVYRKSNFNINFFRKGKIVFLKNLKILAIVSFVFLSISSLGLGNYIYNLEKEVKNMSSEEKKEQQQKNGSESTEQTTPAEQQSSEQKPTEQPINPPSAKDQTELITAIDPPSAQDQIEFITAAEEPDVKKAQEADKKTSEENRNNNK